MPLPRSATRVYGHLPDPKGHRRTHVRMLVGSGTYPTSASLAAFLPSVLDQGPRGRCIGEAKAGAIYTSGKGKIFLPSPTDIYTLARAVDRVPNSDGTLPPLVDEGSQPNQADRAIAEWGVRPFDDTIDGPDISDADLNAEPDLEDLEADSATKLIGSYALDETAPDFEAQIARTIAAGYAITFALPDTDDSFEAYTTGVLEGPTGRIYGGHELFCFAYAFASDGTITIEGQNSWGTTWGMSGRFRGGPQFIKRWIDVQAMSLREVAA